MIVARTKTWIFVIVTKLLSLIEQGVVISAYPMPSTINFPSKWHSFCFDVSIIAVWAGMNCAFISIMVFIMANINFIQRDPFSVSLCLVPVLGMVKCVWLPANHSDIPFYLMPVSWFLLLIVTNWQCGYRFDYARSGTSPWRGALATWPSFAAGVQRGQYMRRGTFFSVGKNWKIGLRSCNTRSYGKHVLITTEWISIILNNVASTVWPWCKSNVNHWIISDLCLWDLSTYMIISTISQSRSPF